MVDASTPLSDASVSPPLSAQEFCRLAQTLYFTNGADREVVSDLYERTLNQAMGSVHTLALNRCGWTDEQLTSFASMLCLCTLLESLSFGRNVFSDAGVVALAAAMSHNDVLPRLQSLALGRNTFGGIGLQAIGKALGTGLSGLKKLWLDNCAFTSVDVASFIEQLASADHPLAMKMLDLSGNQVDDAALHRLCAAHLNGKLPALRELKVQNCDCTPEAASAWEATPVTLIGVG